MTNQHNEFKNPDKNFDDWYTKTLASCLASSIVERAIQELSKDVESAKIKTSINKNASAN